jgi:hypothetical protein
MTLARPTRSNFYLIMSRRPICRAKTSSRGYNLDALCSEKGRQ